MDSPTANQPSPTQSTTFVNRGEAGAEQPAGLPWRRRAWRKLFGWAALVLIVAAVAGVGWFFSRYRYSAEMKVPIVEFSKFEYAEDPAGRSPLFGEYSVRTLRLVQKDATHFDFVFRSPHEHVAEVVFRDVDVSLMTPGLPAYAAEDEGLRRIALTDREWNRQQVQFGAASDMVEISGGDGFEQENLAVASLAKNCLNAGLWEVLLFTKIDGKKEMYYQGWFTFPMGQYKRLWEQNTNLSYWDDLNWYRMEHWCDPAGNLIPLEKLREEVKAETVEVQYDPEERIMFAGEQIRKQRTTMAENVRNWGDLREKHDDVRFASFIPPGTYSVSHPWANEYWRVAKLEGATVRRIVSKATGKESQELELKFSDKSGKQVCRFFVGGIDLASLPQLPTSKYNEGLYMPMGIGVPPFYQDYEQLLANPPTESEYYSFLLDEDGRWIDHHSTAIDGPVMHRDAERPELVHLYLLSYERHTLVGHFTFPLPAEAADSAVEKEQDDP